jgi:hypothetical protein
MHPYSCSTRLGITPSRAGVYAISLWFGLEAFAPPRRHLRGTGFANFNDLYQIDPDLSIAKSEIRNNPPWR